MQPEQVVTRPVERAVWGIGVTAGPQTRTAECPRRPSAAVPESRALLVSFIGTKERNPMIKHLTEGSSLPGAVPGHAPSGRNAAEAGPMCRHPRADTLPPTPDADGLHPDRRSPAPNTARTSSGRPADEGEADADCIVQVDIDPGSDDPTGDFALTLACQDEHLPDYLVPVPLWGGTRWRWTFEAATPGEAERLAELLRRALERLCREGYLEGFICWTGDPPVCDKCGARCAEATLEDMKAELVVGQGRD